MKRAATRPTGVLSIEPGGDAGPRFWIEDVYPSVDGGRHAAKRICGQPVDVWADIVRDGHEVVAGQLLWRGPDEREWRTVPLTLHENDRWTASFIPTTPGHHAFAIAAWTDGFGTWRRDALLKQAAGKLAPVDIAEGRALVTAAETALQKPARGRPAPKPLLSDQAGLEELLDENLALAMQAIQPRPDYTQSAEYPLLVERVRARCGAWYELFPRSQGGPDGRHGTFDDCIARLPDIAEMGFDVLYMPPIHPIGAANRKGRNNALRAEPGDPGSPYAIGSADGGHDAVHPELGTIADFGRLVAACREHGMEVALDFAIQCSPDHPWLREHPEWFKRRADGSIRYAENPPKRYEDIVNPDLYCADREALWNALLNVLLFWIEHGVRIFRVDNPHTKPLPFWAWLLGKLHRSHPEVIFLSEAFTRPKLMKALAKLGFDQSYTYFTWRTSKPELEAYLTEITRYPVAEYFRPNFFVNTPDILPYHLQTGEPWMFKARVALAATLSSNYGVYSGYELLEHEPIEGREEYLNSEKYEIKPRDWKRPGHIRDYIGRLNRLRRAHAALQQTSNLRFAQVDDGEVIGFVKESVDRADAVAVAIALQPGPREFWFHFGEIEIGSPERRGRVAAIENLVTGERHPVSWGGVRLRIDPDRDPALFFSCFTE